MFSSPRGAATLSLVTIVALVGLKLSVGLIIGSISVLSDALDSGVDLIAAVIALGAVWFAARPADAEHPYGHGKIESLSAIAEAALIFGGAGFITYEATRRLTSGVDVDGVGLGIFAMGISVALNLGVSLHLRRVARETNSPALAATALHRASDILTSLAVLVGLILIQTTPWDFLDPAVAIGVAAIVFWTALRLFRRAFQELLDVRLSDDEEEHIRQVLGGHAGSYVSYHSLRTRRSGRLRYVDLHLVVPRLTTVAQAHRLTDDIEQDIEAALPQSLTTIHVEPCEIPEYACDERCPFAPSPHCYEVGRLAEDLAHPHAAR